MANSEYDKDILEFFSKLLEDTSEINLLKDILSGAEFDEVIEKYLDSIGAQEHD